MVRIAVLVWSLACFSYASWFAEDVDRRIQLYFGNSQYRLIVSPFGFFRLNGMRRFETGMGWLPVVACSTWVGSFSTVLSGIGVFGGGCCERSESSSVWGGRL